MENLKPTLSKRVLSALLDVVVFYVLALIFNSFVMTPIIKSATDYNAQYEIYENKLIATGLVFKSQDNLKLGVSSFNIEAREYYDETIVNFYTKVCPLDNQDENEKKLQEYQQSKKNYPSLFVATDVENEFQFSENISNYSDDLKTFFIYAYSYAIDYYMTVDEDYANSYRALVMYENIDKYSSIVLSSLIVFLIIPLIFKQGRSLGKLAMKLKLAQVKDGERVDVNFSTILIRFLAIAVIEIVGSYLVYGIPLLVAIVMIFMTKDGMALHDYIAKTMVIDRGHNGSTDVIEVEAKEKDLMEEN